MSAYSDEFVHLFRKQEKSARIKIGIAGQIIPELLVGLLRNTQRFSPRYIKWVFLSLFEEKIIPFLSGSDQHYTATHDRADLGQLLVKST